MKKNIINIYIILLLLAFSTNINGQCYKNRHNTSWNDAWTSCDTKQNPNPSNQDGHWIMYNFGQDYEFKASHIWNLNDPKNLDSGINEFQVDYSLDGANWKSWGTYQIEQATGNSIYEGTTGPNLSGTIAQYILITALSNHGGQCYGLSEIKFEISDTYITSVDLLNNNYCLKAQLSPNPTTANTTLSIVENCHQQMSYQIVDLLGKLVQKQTIIHPADQKQLDIQSSSLNPGVYLIEIYSGNKKQTIKLIKMKP